MAGKISTLVLKVDLECHLCYKKIRKTLAKLQDRENIKTISYDEKNNLVTISGPFDPKKLSKKLHNKASKVIKDIQIIETKEEPKEPSKEEPKEPSKEELSKEEPKEPSKEEQKEPTKAEKENPKPEAPSPKVEPDRPKAEPMDHCHPPAVWPVCCYIPHYESYYGGWRCRSCGKVYGWVPNGPPMIPFEDPSASCTIM